MSKPSGDTNDSRGPAPERLGQALRQLHKEALVIPPQVDQAVLNQAREQFMTTFRHRRRPFGNWATWTQFGIRHYAIVIPKCPLLSWAAWSAVAAALVLGFWLIQSWVGPKQTSPTVKAIAREDVNRDGQVDIFDAFALARLLESQRNPSLELDMDRDGAIDQEDIDHIALRAVRLTEPSLAEEPL